MSGNYIVKISNEMNTVELGKLSAREADLFAAVCAFVKEKGIKTVSMSFEQIRDMSGYSDRDNKRLVDDLKALNLKLSKLYYEFEDDEQVVGFNLFQWWKISKSKKQWEIAVSDVFEFMLNNFSGEFTRFELDVFTAIESKYAKHLYRLLKQFRSTGIYCVHFDDFKRLLDIPKTYKTTTQIDQKVINPAMNELKDHFEDLKVEKTRKSGRGRGGKVVVGYEFTFKKQRFKDDGKMVENVSKDLKMMIAETEMFILSTEKAMEKKADKGDWKSYENHKQKNIYFKEKLERLKKNLDAFTVDGEQETMQMSPDAQAAQEAIKKWMTWKD